VVGLSRSDGVGDPARIAGERGPMEALRRDDQGPRRVEVGVGGGLLIARAPGQEPVGALEVGARPAPDAVEARAVADGGASSRAQTPVPTPPDLKREL
jgi:hypothetical protein